MLTLLKCDCDANCLRGDLLFLSLSKMLETGVQSCES